MADLNALQKALPLCGLEPKWLAFIDLEGFPEEKEGYWERTSIVLLEPPAGQRVPYVNAWEAMTLLFRYQGMPKEKAQAKAKAECAELMAQVDASQRVLFFTFFSITSDEHIPAPALIQYLRQKKLVSEHFAGFFDRAVVAAVETPMFKREDSGDPPWSLACAPQETPPKEMIEFVCSAPGEDEIVPQFDVWRESIRPIAAALEKALGEQVYDFEDPDYDCDDDHVHRFLVLHWLCTMHPESDYVHFLVERSGAKDVEDLKAALICPESYTQPFEMNDTFLGMETESFRMKYSPPGARS